MPLHHRLHLQEFQLCASRDVKRGKYLIQLSAKYLITSLCSILVHACKKRHVIVLPVLTSLLVLTLLTVLTVVTVEFVVTVDSRLQ